VSTRLLIGDAFDRMAQLDDGSFDLIVTSPPFGWLRSYLPDDHPQKHLEIGSEATPAEYLDILLALTAEWRRLLAPHGSLAVELGDTYAGSGGAGGDYGDEGWRAGQLTYKQRQQAAPSEGRGPRIRDRRHNAVTGNKNRDKRPGWPLDKSLTGIPTLYAWSLAYGRNLLTGAESPAGRWRIRNLKPWIRSNPPVGALGDKERPATSYITVACTGRDRWFDLDAVRTADSRSPDPRPKSPKEVSLEQTGNRHPGTMDDHARGGAPPLDWVVDTDLIIDHELDQGAHQWTKKSSPNSTSSPQKAAGGATDTTRAANFESSETATAACESSAANTADGPGGEAPTSRLLGPLDTHHIDAVIDAELDYRSQQRDRGSESPSPKTLAVERGDGGYRLKETGVNRQSGARGVHIRRALQQAGILPGGDHYLDISPRGYSGAHYAVWPPELVQRLISEMCPPGGRVLDPFVGSGTTLMVASGMGRDSVGIDLDPRSADLATERVGMFLDIDYGTQETVT